MGKTTDVAADRSNRPTETVVPAEAVRDFILINPPSLAAWKLFHLMLGTAAGRMADDTRHQMRMASIDRIEDMRKPNRKSLTALFRQLRGAVLQHGDPDLPQQVEIGGLIEHAVIETPDEAGDALITWRFDALFRAIAARSDHWAILDRQAVFHMQSRYSVQLYQHVAAYQNYDRVQKKEFTVPELRALLGIRQGKIERFADLRTKVLAPAIAEINQLSRLTLTATTEKTGRTVTKVTIHWTKKADPGPAKRELAASKVGRRPRRDGTAETPAAPPFPASGGIAFAPYWLDRKRKAGCTMDNTLIADKFRAFCAARGIRLNAWNIADVFDTFCRTIGRL